jgi:methylthioribulose-1-phosphate dehydratase
MSFPPPAAAPSPDLAPSDLAPSDLAPSDLARPDLARLVAVVRDLGARNLVPATSGNFSMRLDAQHIAITRSGADKGALVESDLLVIPLQGESRARTSAETPLHLGLYRHDPGIGAVLHIHSLAATVLSRMAAAEGVLIVEGYELQKALAGQTTHTGRLVIDVHGNDQDIPALTRRVQAAGSFSAPARCFLLAGHGLYAWGATVDEAYRHVIALEFLLNCLLEEHRIRR